jgi:DNA-binding transcriptional LysR family regulator
LRFSRLPLFPNLKIKLCNKLAADLSHDLMNGTLDMAFLTGMPETPRISSATVSNQPFFVAMLEDDDLALRTEVKHGELADVSCILFERHVHPTLYDALCMATKAATKPGTSIHHVMTPEDASQFVLRGFGVAVLTQAGAWRIAHNGITIRPLCVDGLRLETRLACRSDSQRRVVSEVLRGFVRRLKERTNVNQLRLGFSN